MTKQRTGNRYTRSEAAVKAIKEYFQLGYKPGEAYREINKSELLANTPPRIGRTTIYKLYNEWVKADKPGALQFIGNKTLPDGAVVAIYRDKYGNEWTGKER